ncbi:MAG: hypothetical protein WEG36_07120 [Gemmatimonadota bacterium]
MRVNHLLNRAESLARRLLPALFAEMNRTGHAGHCIYVSRVIDLVFNEYGVRSEPLCVDFEFANASAIQQMAEGRALEPPAMIAKTGSETFDGYLHHVVTLVRDGPMALLLDPTIIQLERHLLDVTIPPVMITLPWPRVDPLLVDIGGGCLTYSFRPRDEVFKTNEQWSDLSDAKARAAAVLRQMNSGS